MHHDWIERFICGADRWEGSCTDDGPYSDLNGSPFLSLALVGLCIFVLPIELLSIARDNLYTDRWS